MKLQTTISSALYFEVESLAKCLGVSRSELMRRALVAYIQSNGDDATSYSEDTEGVRKALDEIYLTAESNVDGTLSRMQWASLPREHW